LSLTTRSRGVAVAAVDFAPVGFTLQVIEGML
jgi:hypothetical protein